MVKSKHPELDKISAVSEDSQKLGEFIEWLHTQGYHFAKYIDHQHTEDCYEMRAGIFTDTKRKTLVCGYNEGNDNFMQVYPRINELLADYFGIDENQAERERRAILEELRG